MSQVIVLGAGPTGLAAALLLTRDGHEVTLLERDASAVPEGAEAAWDGWDRDGVVQFRQAHILISRGSRELADVLPDVSDEMRALGAIVFDVLALMPPSITDRAPRPGDERFATLTARRPVMELAFARVAEREPGLTLRRGVAVEGLMCEGDVGVPHVRGVRTTAGEELRADLVVDAMGRRSPLVDWLRAVGVTCHEEAEDSGFIYYTRFFRARPGMRVPDYRAPVITEMGSFSILLLPSDDDTWSITLYVAAGDQPLKALRNEETFTSLVASLPMHAHWLDGEPITGVHAMGGVLDRYRRLATEDGRPLVTGVTALGDAWACTNPSLGRGMTLGLMHATRLRDVARGHLGGEPIAFATAMHATTEAELTPWYRETVEIDRARLREMELARDGALPEGPVGPGPALMVAAALDADLFRAMLELRGCLASGADVFSRPGLIERIDELVPHALGGMPPPPAREELLALVA